MTIQKWYMPIEKHANYCEWLKLCSVRKEDGKAMVSIKYLDWRQEEVALNTVINNEEINWKKIVRVYSSGHVFLDKAREKVFLVTTQKEGRMQHQFTGGSPLEMKNKDVIRKENWIYNIDIERVKANARLRTKNRTTVEVLEEYNNKPIVDWVLMEKDDYFRLVCLMHFEVKAYSWVLSYTNNEEVVDANWYRIDELLDLEDVAPNAYLVSREVQKLIRN